MRLAYADPPYPGQSKRLYGKHPDYAGEVDHAELIERLNTYDGWALSTSGQALKDVLALCPDDVRVCVWQIADPRPFPPARLIPSWEPVILRGWRRLKDSGELLVRDAVTLPVLGTRQDVIGQKSPAFCQWLFRLLGARPWDELDDLFPGSGAVSRAWDAFSRQLELCASPALHRLDGCA